MQRPQVQRIEVWLSHELWLFANCDARRVTTENESRQKCDLCTTIAGVNKTCLNPGCAVACGVCCRCGCCCVAAFCACAFVALHFLCLLWLVCRCGLPPCVFVSVCRFWWCLLCCACRSSPASWFVFLVSSLSGWFVVPLPLRPKCRLLGTLCATYPNTALLTCI